MESYLFIRDLFVGFNNDYHSSYQEENQHDNRNSSNIESLNDNHVINNHDHDDNSSDNIVNYDVQND